MSEYQEMTWDNVPKYNPSTDCKVPFPSTVTGPQEDTPVATAKRGQMEALAELAKAVDGLYTKLHKAGVLYGGSANLVEAPSTKEQPAKVERTPNEMFIMDTTAVVRKTTLALYTLMGRIGT